MESLKSTLFRYAPVRREEHDDSEASFDSEKDLPPVPNRRHWVPWFVHGLLLLGWLALYAFTWTRGVASEVNCRDELFSPAREAVEYEDIIFTSNIYTKGPKTPKTIYSGPLNDENDEAWKRLTRGGMVTFDEAANNRIGNKSHQYFDEPGVHFGNVEMFHSLHCVDILRREYYYVNGTHFPDYHIDHCIEYLRQTIQCQGDLNIMPFKLDDEGFYRPQFDNLHRCRKFDKIYDWVIDHKAGNMITA